jgi:predicted nucleic acid-binding protein
MTFLDILAGESVFIDANVFVYPFAADPTLGPPCQDLAERIGRKEVDGFLSTSVLSEIAHRLMTLEACVTFGWPYPGIAQRLRRHPGEIMKLLRYRDAIDEIIGLGVHVLSVTQQHVLLAGDLSRHHGVLSGDALILATMQLHGLKSLASNDSDFDRVPGVVRYSPIA